MIHHSLFTIYQLVSRKQEHPLATAFEVQPGKGQLGKRLHHGIAAVTDLNHQYAVISEMVTRPVHDAPHHVQAVFARRQR